MDTNQFKRTLKEYFTFTRGERTGIFILLLLIILSFLANLLLRNIGVKEKRDFTELKRVIMDWEQSKVTVRGNIRTFFAFDPNTIDREALDSLDFPDRIKNNMVKYRESGGHFRSVNDLRKIYGMNDSLYALISSYVCIGTNPVISIMKTGKDLLDPSKEKDQETESFENERPVNNSGRTTRSEIELNSADSALLVSVNGIGPVLASRIIKYRNLLGGFHSVEQLTEIYGLRPESYQKMAGLFVADSVGVKKIRLNFSEFMEMAKHPYLDKNQVNLILRYRSKNGPFRSTDDLLKFNLVDSSTFCKVKFYLTTD